MRLANDGKTEVKSVLGASLSLLMIILLLIYTGYKSKIFIEKSKSTITEAVMKKFYSQEDEFSADHGLMIVAGMTSELPAEVGTLSFYTS